eukprot:scpid94154/ scgid14266/ 
MTDVSGDPIGAKPHYLQTVIRHALGVKRIGHIVVQMSTARGPFLNNPAWLQRRGQTGSADCGLFAIAFVVELSVGNDPSTACFNQKKMRGPSVLLLCNACDDRCPRPVHGVL